MPSTNPWKPKEGVLQSTGTPDLWKELEEPVTEFYTCIFQMKAKDESTEKQEPETYSPNTAYGRSLVPGSPPKSPPLLLSDPHPQLQPLVQ